MTGGAGGDEPAPPGPAAPAPTSAPGPAAPGASPARRRRRALAAASLAAASLALPLGGLGVAERAQRGPEPAVAPLGPGERPPPRVREAPPPARAGADEDGDGLDDALEAALARRFAPRLRFAGLDPAGPPSRQHRLEAHFPASVAGFLAALEVGVWETPAGWVRTAPGRREPDRIVGFPSGLAGDPVGEAPVYVHVAPAGGPGEVFCEYWLFYLHDRADAAFLGRPTPIADHRGDWEHVAWRLALEGDGPRLVEGYFYGHALALHAAAYDLEVVDGEHPVVYVSQGKHAAFPSPCVVSTTGLPRWLVDHDDVANGRGPVWDTWTGLLVDLGERDRPSPAAAGWLGYAGRWGPERLAGHVGMSPTGPARKPSWGRHGPGVPWREHVARRGGAVLARPDR